jgi:integrase/recombinase XerD
MTGCCLWGVGIHQLHQATELINVGVSIETVRKRLGHSSAALTEVYAADAEIRAAHRNRDRRRP